MEIKSEQPLSYAAQAPKQANTSFGTQVSEQAHEKKNEEIQDRAPFGAQVSEQAHAKKADNVQDSAAVTAKKQLNKSILQASMDVNLSTGNNPMALLFKTALEGVNKALEGDLGPNAIQKSYDSGLDVSPQATADRIVQFSTAFFDKYQANHPEQSTEEALNSFTTLIGGGIDKGFKEARDILEGLNVLKEGNIGTNIDATYELVQKGLKAFVENYKKPDVTEPDTSA
ncbi:MAG: DUF5610 domain-containing protein [Methylobacter sp.]|nr:DUF5610 domain-containing protein [Methylobacter sp.]